MTDRKNISQDEFREQLGVSRTSFWRLAQEPDFPKKIMLTKRCIRYYQDEIEAYIQSRQVGACA